MILSNFVKSYILPAQQQGRDYTGPRGWVHLANLLLRRLETEGMEAMGRLKEFPVKVAGNYFVTPPADYRVGERMYIPSIIAGEDVELTFEEVNGGLRLETPVKSGTSSIACFLSSISSDKLSGVLSTDTTNFPWIKDADALVGYAFLLGAYSFVITGSVFSGTPYLVNITFDRVCTVPAPNDPATMTKEYVLLRYRSTFSPMAAAGDEIPLEDKYEFLLASWLAFQAEAYDAKMRMAYLSEFEADLDRIKSEVFTPTAAQARPHMRRVSGLDALL